jgi:hypothetical protein
MKNRRVNIDRDVQSRKNIAAARPIPPRKEEPKPAQPPKDEPKEESKEEAETQAASDPVPKSKRSGRQTQGNA